MQLVDTERVLGILETIPISIQCWQGDDVLGFEIPTARSPEASRPAGTILAAHAMYRSYAGILNSLFP